MIASEFAFLALGLILGVATGAALVEVLRARPPGAREIRVTVAPNSIQPRRATTLAENAFSPVMSGPVSGEPGDRRWTEIDPDVSDVATLGRRTDARLSDAAPGGESDVVARTPVRSEPGMAPGASVDAPTTTRQPGQPRPAPAWLSAASANGPSAGLVAVPMSMEPDPDADALRATAERVGVAVAGAGSSQRAEAATAMGKRATTRAVEPATTEDADPETGGGQASSSGPCAEERRVADERCSVAGRAREGAAGAAEALRVAQRAYDTHLASAESGAAATDPRSVRAAKESAQGRFRDARGKAATRDDVEAAARTWLSEINEINHDTREAAHRVERDRASANALVPVLERLAVEADAARISAERADEACMAAREAVVACDEARTLAAAATASGKTRGRDRVAAAMLAPDDEFGGPLPMSARAAEDALLLRILRGERDAMLAAVARIGGDDPEARRRWQTWLSSLAEALIARAIEATAFDFPVEHPFWGPFSRDQSRDIAAGLSSLGYRFDGFGGWVDDHIPAQRDLSMAVGYAGLDPMRIRRWPTEPEMHALFAEVRVAVDEYVAGAAGGLTLGEMVTLLGRRADALTELWNEWGTARPILLAAD